MFLPQTAEYALRAVAQMAHMDGKQAVRTKDVAELTQVPVHYLSKIMRRLVAHGLLESEKGHGGGFRFARPPHDIRFSEVLQAVGFEVEPNRCAFGWGRCKPQKPCLLHVAFTQLNSQFTLWAERTTLRDIARQAPNARSGATRRKA